MVVGVRFSVRKAAKLMPGVSPPSKLLADGLGGPEHRLRHVLVLDMTKEYNRVRIKGITISS